MSNSEVSKERHNAKVVGYTKCMSCGEVVELLEIYGWKKSDNNAIDVACKSCNDYLNSQIEKP